MTNFDSRYNDAQDTPTDIIIGTGVLAVPLSSIKRAIDPAGLLPNYDGRYYKKEEVDALLVASEIETDDKIVNNFARLEVLVSDPVAPVVGRMWIIGGGV